MTPIVGFAPDADPDTPGVLTACSQIMSNDFGYIGAPTGRATTAAALAAECRGAVVATKLDGTRRVFAGSQTKLYELSGTAWTDRSAGGGSYTGSTESRWSWAQFGDTTVASNLSDAMQSSASGAFAAIAAAPKAKAIVSVANNFLIAFYTNEGTYGVAPDRWWCCAQNDQTTWAPSVATGATTGRLIASEGPLTAAIALGDYCVAFKSRALWVGSFVGSSNGTWQFTLVPGSDCGAVGVDAVCSIGSAVFCVGEDDFWIFDGTRPVSVGEGVRNWFRANSSQTFRYRTRVAFDRQRNCVWVNYPSASSTGLCDRTLVYHIGRKRWGSGDFTGEAFLNFVAPGVTINGLDAYSSTIDGLPTIPFDSQYWLAGGRALSYFNGSHVLVTNDGACAASSLTTGNIGDDDLISTLERVRVRFTQVPTTASATALYAMNEGEGYTPTQPSPKFDGAFQFHQAGRFHRVRVDMTGDHAETGYDARMTANTVDEQ